MHHYRVYGTTFASALEFPELPAIAAGPSRWQLDVVDALPEPREPQLLGEEPIYGEVRARLIRHREGHRITVDDTGAFEIGPNGRITWERRESAWPDFVRAHCLGRVMATSLYLDGWLPLHGSAVRFRDGVVAFIAPKGAGKSSLALALARAGAALVTDDTLPIDDAAPPRAWPGVQGLRLRDDSLRALGVGAGGARERTRDDKVMLLDPAELPMQTDPAPLTAIYLVGPSDPAGPVERLEFAPPLAALGVVAHVKIGAMLGPTAAPTLMERTARVVAHARVHRLVVPRELARLPEVVDRLLAWHGGAA